MVLMKNDNNALPLKKDAKIAVIGEMARTPRYQGAGSSLINPIKLDSAYSTMKEMGINFSFAPGYTLKGKNKKEMEMVVEAKTYHL